MSDAEHPEPKLKETYAEPEAAAAVADAPKPKRVLMLHGCAHSSLCAEPIIELACRFSGNAASYSKHVVSTCV
jgi:uncharacterized phosphosugar-binding protein